MCFNGCANPGRRERRVANHGDNLFELRPRPRQIAGYVDIESVRSPGTGINQIDVTSLFIDNRVRSCRCRHDVKVIVTRELCDLLRIDAIAEEIHGVIAIGEKVNRIADPHRERVVTVCPRKFLD